MRKFTALTAFVLLATLLLTACQPQPQSAISEYDYSQMQLVQTQILQGELDDDRPVAVITTTHGEIRVALFPEYAPATVANFIENVKEGFYDDIDILGIQQQAVFYTGSDSDGQVKKDENGEAITIPNEYSVNMWPFKGAVGSFGSMAGVGDSRFFIINQESMTKEDFERLREMKVNEEEALPDKLVDAFEKFGCAVAFSGFYTIFGQVIGVEGTQVVETICESRVDRRMRPLDEIKIIKIELE